MNKTSEIHVELIHFSKFTKRTTDLDRVYWFSYPIDLLDHPDFFEVSPDEIVAFIDLVSVAAMKKSKSVRINLEYMEHKRKLKKGTFISMLGKLEGKQTLAGLRPNGDQTATDGVRTAASTLHYITSHNITKYSSPEPAKLFPGTEQFPSLTFFHEINPIKESLILTWVEQYGEDWVREELASAKAWCLANALKTPKSATGRFLNSWLKNGWERHRKTIASTKVSRIDYDSI